MRRHADGAHDAGWIGLRQRSRRELDLRHAEALGDLRRAVAELERPDRVGGVHVHGAVTCDARGPRVAGDRGADRGRPAVDELRHAGLRPVPRELAADVVSERIQLPPPRVARASIGSAVACVVVITVCPIPATRSASTRRRTGSSSDRTSSSKRSGGAGSSSASASRSERTARRCSPCEPKWRRSRSPLAISTSSRCGPRPVDAAFDVARQTRVELLLGRCGAGVRESRRRQPELPRAFGERRCEHGQRSGPFLDELGRQPRERSRPRCERGGVGVPELHASQRGVPLRKRREVRLRNVGTCREEAAERTVEVRASCCRPALHDRQPVWGEDERRDLASQRLGRRQACAVQRRLLRLPLAERHGELERRRATAAANRDACGRLAEANELRVLAGARREPLRRDVQRLEQVRLPDAVRPDGEHDARLEVEIERRVRPVLAKSDVLDDQPASRIGMIRYT